jgi:hypothetical protein
MRDKGEEDLSRNYNNSKPGYAKLKCHLLGANTKKFCCLTTDPLIQKTIFGVI